MIPQHHRTR